jgi:DNA-directed RNA polymerase subunit RPC12/RpoP
MVELECLVCGETVKIPKFIDTDNYDGQVVCQNCTSLLHVKLVQSKVRQYKVVDKKFRRLTADELLQIKQEAERELREQGYTVDKWRKWEKKGGGERES